MSSTSASRLDLHWRRRRRKPAAQSMVVDIGGQMLPVQRNRLDQPDECQARVTVAGATGAQSQGVQQSESRIAPARVEPTAQLDLSLSGRRRKMTSSRMLWSLFLCLFVQFAPSQEQQLQATSPSSLALANPLQLAAEARGDPALNQLKPSGSAFDHLVNLLNTYANQPNNVRRPQLPPNSRLPQQNQLNSQQQIPTQQVSTPSNPFQMASGQFGQPIRRLNGNANLGGPNGNQNNQQRPQQPPQQTNFVASSPPTPYLTLNRIAAMANQQQQSQQNNRPMALQPINTIPLGSISGQQRPQMSNQSPQVNQMAPRPSQQQQPQQQRTQFNPSRPVMVPMPQLLVPNQSQNNQQPRPTSGFAPSGPPPSLSGGSLSSPPVVAQSVPEVSPSSEVPPTTIAFSTTSNPTTTTTTTAAAGLIATSTATTTSTTAATTTTEGSSSTSTAPISSEQPDRANSSSESSWAPVQANKVGSGSTERPKLAPSPDIVTVPPGYNPESPSNQPQSYDISVSAQMGGQQQRPANPVRPSSSPSSLASIPSQAPTEVTTIVWSTATQEPSTRSSSAATSPPSAIQPTTTQQVPAMTTSSTYPVSPPSRIRDSSGATGAPEEPPTAPSSVVYGRAPNKDSKPPAPALSPSPVMSHSTIETALPGRPSYQSVPIDNQVRPYSGGAATNQQSPVGVHLKSNHLFGAPFKPSRPYGSGGLQTPMSVGSAFTIAGNQSMPTGDIQDYLANQPSLLAPPQTGGRLAGSFPMNDEPATISAHGGPDPFELSGQDSANQPTGVQSNNNRSSIEPTGSNTNRQQPAQPSTSPAPRLRRPTFKAKPAVPPIRIDSCIVGDDSSCEQAHNERCFTEYGISSCHCKPGYARQSQIRGLCSPVSSLQLNLKIDRLADDRRLAFNKSLENPNSEEFQYLEFESVQALAGAIGHTSLAGQFMGAKVNKFFEKRGKIYANMNLQLNSTNVTTNAKQIQPVAAQELLKVASKRAPVGDSTVVLAPGKEAFSELSDVDECASRELNDCSKFASCTNVFGGFHCQCLPGYDDKHVPDERAKHTDEERAKQGRVCVGCSPSYCSNRGECSIQDGQKTCKCRPNFMGARCDIDSEVLAVAVGGSLVGIIILVVTFWCLYVFNRKWRREQQKMDAMSATSGLTYNYVNSSTNSLMSPNARMLAVPNGQQTIGAPSLHRSAGHQVGLSGGRLARSIGAAQQAYDQQAIMGSSSSSAASSAASQPIGCNPYAPPLASVYHQGHQYDDAGLLIAPISTDSSEQTSPSGNSYRNIVPHSHAHHLSAGNAYTLSGHHYHHQHQAHLQHQLMQQQQHQHHHHHHHQPKSQFHPAATTDYRTLNQSAAGQHPYDARWRAMQHQRALDPSGKQPPVGYYLVS